ncbi:MAG: hypothetical protein RR329_04145 [Mucinivorans sp.]
MKTFNLFAVAMAALTMFSCQKQDEISDSQNDEPISVNLRIGVPGSDSRTVEPPLTSLTTVNLTSGIVFFITPQGDIVATKDIDVALIATTNGQTFTDIRPSASEVYIVGNQTLITQLDTDLKACKTKTALLAVTSSIDNQQAIPQNIILANTIDKTGYPNHDGLIKPATANYKALVLLAPIFSRIQVADIKTTDPNILSFKFKGIYVDNYYPSYYVSAINGGAGTKLTVGTDGSKLGKTPYMLFDQPAVPVADGGDKKVTAAETQVSISDPRVWGYQTTPTLAGTANTPRLIVVLTDIVLASGSIPGPKYLTVTGFTDGVSPIANFEPGKLYNIAPDKFIFSYKDLSDNPNTANLTVTVTVTVKPWQLTNVNPVL